MPRNNCRAVLNTTVSTFILTVRTLKKQPLKIWQNYVIMICQYMYQPFTNLV